MTTDEMTTDKLSTMSNEQLAHQLLLGMLHTIVLGGEHIRRQHREMTESGTPAPPELRPVRKAGTCRDLLATAHMLDPVADAAEVQRLLLEAEQWMHEGVDLCNLLRAMRAGTLTGYHLRETTARVA